MPKIKEEYLIAPRHLLREHFPYTKQLEFYKEYQAIKKNSDPYQYMVYLQHRLRTLISDISIKETGKPIDWNAKDIPKLYKYVLTLFTKHYVVQQGRYMIAMKKERGEEVEVATWVCGVDGSCTVDKDNNMIDYFPREKEEDVPKLSWWKRIKINYKSLTQ